eukprot:CAMPEP_0116128274 /NCGR_PEP_ID=MMETSP0329-20121206/7274_1 /TAXON_ID=697910 /ORGANISM="Pseudo-nitzschia arenysensis, Strain B593" /LENGTH=514 /DNA_ID=CAMNT_0003622405 /DNA_START=171 /DNA_END=1712 /DNA_ORIENTATION=-
MNISFDSSEDGNRDELFTPIRGGRKSLMPDFSPTPSRSGTSEELATPAPKSKNKNAFKKRTNVVSNNNNNNNNNNASFFADDSSNTLPKLHNSSWLGADMSPIRQGQETINVKKDTAALIPNYPSGLNDASDSSAAATESFFLGVNEDTDEFEDSNSNSKEQTPTTNAKHANNNGAPKAKFEVPRKSSGRTSLPLFSHMRPESTPNGNDQQPQRRRFLDQPKFWNFWSDLTSSPSENGSSNSLSSRLASIRIHRGNRYVMGATAFVLFCIGIHDAFLGYLAMRRGDNVSLAWSLPWMGPTQRSLLLFGAFCPERILKSPYEYWRCLTSIVLPTSLVEWLLLVWVWTMYLPTSLVFPTRNFSCQLSWLVVYLLSAVTGQLWMAAFHYETIRLSVSQEQQNSDLYEDSSLPALSGCAGWATAGVLCAVGIQATNRRFPCFVSSIAFVVLHQLEATGSVIGCSAAAFFGWAYSGFWSVHFTEETAKRWQREMLHRDYTYYYDVLQERGDALNEAKQW